jgi:hypothetical protein
VAHLGSGGVGWTESLKPKSPHYPKANLDRDG